MHEHENDEFFWTTADGRELKPSQMTSRHIQNCINLLERRLEDILTSGFSALSMLQGEMAQAQVESDMEYQEGCIRETINIFKVELERRA